VKENALLEKAISLAVEKFRDVVDKEGQPYMLHLMRVMLGVDSIQAKTAAVLHDIVEDTDITIDDLIALGFSELVLEAIACLTHRTEWTYAEYIIRLSKNLIATQCKIADLADNYRLDRVAFREGHEAEDARRIQRYILSYQFLIKKMDEESYRRRMKALG
jgi:(p)ppGpp synthase/HD superfamily hydrolase